MNRSMRSFEGASSVAIGCHSIIITSLGKNRPLDKSVPVCWGDLPTYNLISQKLPLFSKLLIDNSLLGHIVSICLSDSPWLRSKKGLFVWWEPSRRLWMIQECIAIQGIGHVLGSTWSIDPNTWPCHDIGESLRNSSRIPERNAEVISSR